MIMTDGLTDQVGGDDHERPISFSYRRLSQLILAHKEKRCQAIADEIPSRFLSWQGSQSRRDDVSVVLFEP
jgi:sigma-B regulation protein RsbU (phosphoserine phosphatase)